MKRKYIKTLAFGMALTLCCACDGLNKVVQGMYLMTSVNLLSVLP